MTKADELQVILDELARENQMPVEVAARLASDAFSGAGFVRITINDDGTLEYANIDPSEVLSWPKPA